MRRASVKRLTIDNKENILFCIFSHRSTPVNKTAANSAVSDRDAAIHARVLDVFEHQSRTVGPRNVVISQLVGEVGISTKTLYRLFENKSHIVQELINSWADHWFQKREQGISEGLPPKERIERLITQWADHLGRFSREFWRQLERDFPEAHSIYRKHYQVFMEHSRQSLLVASRDDLNAGLALSSLMALVDHAGTQGVYDRHNMTRRDALVEVIGLWATGALKQEYLS